MPDQVVAPGYETLLALVMVIGVSGYLGLLAEQAVRRGASFVKGYFLGNRGLGVWTMALTATVQSGGTFMGYPAIVYSHGWVVALWISSYMLVPLTGFAVLGKRMAQLSRKLDAITMPDLFRGRFNSPAVGLTASLLILFFMTMMTIAQFKAGAIVMKLAWPGTSDIALVEEVRGGLTREYYIGLCVFTLTVVGYTLFGGFLASVWADLFQSLLMLLGVVILLVLALPLGGGLEQASRTAVDNAGITYAYGPGLVKSGAAAAGAAAFLPLGLAVSYFFVWIYGGMASPASVVRVMACKDTATLRRSIFVLAVYNTLIYIPLIFICIVARAIMPNLDSADEVIPRMALLSTAGLPLGSFLAGLILAAPFGAVMATVSTYLVVIASGLVRDVYQRFIAPDATTTAIRRLTYVVMAAVGALALAANINPVDFLQKIVVFCASGGASSFLVPAFMTAYWRRATAAGAIAAMLCGSGVLLSLFIAGLATTHTFQPVFLAGMEPIIWGIAASAIAGVAVSLATQPPPPRLVSSLFDAPPDHAPIA